MIRTAFGSSVVIAAVMLAYLGYHGHLDDLVQPYLMIIVMLFAAGPSFVAGRFPVWREIFADLRRDPAGQRRHLANQPGAEATEAFARKRSVLAGAERGARVGGAVATLLGMNYGMHGMTEPPEIMGLFFGNSLVGLCYGFMVSDLVLAPIGLRILDAAASDGYAGTATPP